ncbi:MAG: type II secretion system protein [Planctomycetes bacterium]|nr:type II secretion system protein [Planctomycetota bacterium]
MLSRAFTLIELLIVIGIIALLSSMLLVGIGELRIRAKGIDTMTRMEDVLNKLQLVGQADGETAYQIQRDGLGEDFRWDSLRAILRSSDLTGQPNMIPPNMKLREAGPMNVRIADFSLEKQVCWLMRDSVGKYIKNTSGAAWKIGADFYTDDRGNSFPSPLGESLDGTMEVMPPSPQDPTWYLIKWPTVIETVTPNIFPIPPTYNQTCWPVSDWDQAAPGIIPVRWCTPWDHGILSRTTGTIVEQRPQHNLGELSPLNSITLLQLSGILPKGAAGADAYRTDRTTSRPWNDRWGNPLVVVNAVFIPGRYDFNPGEETADLKRGRDYLLKTAKQLYLYNRAVFISVGAVGPKLRTPLPSPWTPTEDAIALRDLWIQIRETTEAAKWDETAFEKPPWQGTRQRKQGSERCFVTVPYSFK